MLKEDLLKVKPIEYQNKTLYLIDQQYKIRSYTDPDKIAKAIKQKVISGDINTSIVIAFGMFFGLKKAEQKEKKLLKKNLFLYLNNLLWLMLLTKILY